MLYLFSAVIPVSGACLNYQCNKIIIRLHAAALKAIFFSQPTMSPQIKISNPSTEHPTTDYFNASSATYFGPYFKINKGDDDNSHKAVNVLCSSDDEEEGSSNLQLHYLDKRNPLWSLFLDGHLMTKEDIFKLTSPYQSVRFRIMI